MIGPVDEEGVRASYDDAVVEVASRSRAVLVRPRRPDHPLRAAHLPTPTYPPSLGWVLPARFEAYDEPRRLAVGTVIDGSTELREAVGEVVFDIDGRSHRLVALGDRENLWILFADATAGRTTYGAGRQLSAEVEPDGSVVLDFNRAINLPCAYTSFATPARSRRRATGFPSRSRPGRCSRPDRDPGGTPVRRRTGDCLTHSPDAGMHCR